MGSARRHLPLLLAIAFAPGCIADNPDYGGEADGSATLDGGRADLARRNDLAVTPACGAGQRTCSGATSLACISGHFAADRACPRESACANGYCAVPPAKQETSQGKKCGSEATCCAAK